MLALCLALALPLPVAAANDFPDGYRAHHTQREVRDDLRALAAAHPSIVRVSSIGRSYEGRKLWLVKISDNVGVDESEPEAYIQGGLHAKEHAGTEQSMALVSWLVTGYGRDARITDIVDSTEIWIVPMVNPDGAMYDISGGVFRAWRKNRQPTAGSSEIGTDINRNFAYRWGCCGNSSADPASAYFRGAKPWSTPEARRIRDFIRSRRVGGDQQIRVALDLHSHGEFVTYPFAYTPDDEPPDMLSGDRDRFLALSNGIADRNGYRVRQYGDMLGADGMFMDWAYARQGIMCLTVELGPLTGTPNGHYLTDADLPGVIDKNRDALLWFLEQAQPAG